MAKCTPTPRSNTEKNIDFIYKFLLPLVNTLHTIERVADSKSYCAELNNTIEAGSLIEQYQCYNGVARVSISSTKLLKEFSRVADDIFKALFIRQTRGKFNNTSTTRGKVEGYAFSSSWSVHHENWAKVQLMTNGKLAQAKLVPSELLAAIKHVSSCVVSATEWQAIDHVLGGKVVVGQNYKLVTREQLKQLYADIRKPVAEQAAEATREWARNL